MASIPVDALQERDGVCQIDSPAFVRRVRVHKAETIFVQNERAKTMFFLQVGVVKLTAVSPEGRQAIVALVNSGSFFGEACLAMHPYYRCSATAATECSLIRLDKQQLLALVHEQQGFAEKFLSGLAERATQCQEDLLDKFFNRSERRLARALVILSHFDQQVGAEKYITGVSHEELAEMIGTTRAHVSVFMNKFRRLGMIEYDRSRILVRGEILRALMPK
jgi:CRP/FNR family transcriptional regulator, cyclic AMP receptor protein